MYSQEDDEAHILKYFTESFKGKFLDIGANDGITFSNTRRLVELGWGGVCVEPDPFAFGKLVENNCTRPDIVLVNAGLGITSGLKRFYAFRDSLLSSFNPKQQEIWKKAPVVRECYVNQITWGDLLDLVGVAFDFVNIDAEGLSIKLLKHLPFDRLSPRMICTEHDGSDSAVGAILAPKGYKRCHLNSLNDIFVKGS